MRLRLVAPFCVRSRAFVPKAVPTQSRDPQRLVKRAAPLSGAGLATCSLPAIRWKAFSVQAMPVAVDIREQLQTALHPAYAIERELGGGGMSRVFVAEETSLGRRVAVKVLPPERSAGVDLERFQREMRLAARLSHPHIVPVLRAGQAGDLLYYTMPFIPGESLRERLRRECQLPLEEALRIAREVADALDYAHRGGIVHRDVKPENILLHDGHALVTDFGISRAVTQATAVETLTQAGLALGTPTYMSPEQASADRDVGARSDVYSLGCVLYEILAGEPPFTGPTAHAILVKRFTEPAPSIRRVREAVPGPVDAAIQRALAKAPADRFATAADFARALTAPMSATSMIDSPSLSAGRKSVAVLPFENLSPDTESEYFSDGMTEDVIARLSKIRDLRVISRTSVMCYKKATRPLREIARELGVATIVEGSVRRAGSRLRVVAQLIDASTDEHLWSESFDRDLMDVFAVQTEIAEEIATALQAALTPAERARLERKPTDNLDAYNLYLLGRYHYHRVTGPDFKKSVECLEGAVRRDPQFAQAHATLSQAYGYFGVGYWGYRPANYLAPARQAAERAVELDPGLGEAHAALGMVRWWQDFDWGGAEREQRQAIALDPNSALSHLQYAVVLATSLRTHEAIPLVERACSLDPASVSLSHNAAFIMRFGRQYDRSRAQIDRGMELDSGSPALYWVLGLLEVDLGRFEEAITALETGVRLTAGGPLFQMTLATAYAAAGRRPDAHRLLADLEARERGGDYLWPVGLAMIHAQLGDIDRGLARLAQAIDERAGWFWIGVEPTLDPLRADPRFDDLLRRVNLASGSRVAGL
jgi:eukaryotic-like serine/threonine-protein kinase